VEVANISELEDLGDVSAPLITEKPKQKQVQKLKNGKKLVPKKKNGCRTIHHSCHSPHKETEFCKNCEAYVELIGKKTCGCCGKEVAKFLKHTWLSRVLKFGIRQHRNFINDWAMFPDQGVEFKTLDKPYTWYQDIFDPKTGKDVIDSKTGKIKKRKIVVTEVYTKRPKRSQMVEIKYRDTVYEIEVKFLALALETNDGSNDKADIRGGEDAKLEIINKHIGIKGLRIWIPDGEIMDTQCNRCHSFLRYDKHDNFFCPKCGKIDSFK